ncbi:uncharacterized protein N7511_008519 [Penicillium nucicola]|uniref:uncharacterized protein n=1 Tax=Penicillium nucicola TaxID=1850975 RepID=UPI00254590CF|nr:uncharacterized protein N7511_011574 [Penicillium nucicola]XP_056978714.1 uncharacterized protein N7511_011380 [Penicillium nucicola]XP_056981627.1 uncharacterized protein N7511_008519 [Penicillium nucicola]KAJ5741202.1 hypothetical protein N7511_011574 [Penicillium nucicola]KAJ5742648.1 hypothetical protein N7511_011380 [Penicillium nucicola]KAJ5751554.1 hypothetical protein N7511_008519 [Penicillium nucicola]
MSDPHVSHLELLKDSLSVSQTASRTGKDRCLARPTGSQFLNQEELYESIELLLGLDIQQNTGHSQGFESSSGGMPSYRPCSEPGRPGPTLGLNEIRHTSVGPHFDGKLVTTLQDAASLGDLFDLATRNGVQLENISSGLSLIRSVLQRSHPEQFELREMGLPVTPAGRVLRPGSQGYFLHLVSPFRERPLCLSAQDYCDHYEYEILTCAYITGAILTQCEAAALSLDETRWSVLKLALDNYQDPRWNVMHRAFWRVWTFCRLFGSGKGREEDWQGQQAWLEGHTIHSNNGFGTNTQPGSLQSEVLDNPPEFFATGNPGGLTSEELKDMMFIWRCLRWLLRIRLYRDTLPQTPRRDQAQGSVKLSEKTANTDWQITDTLVDSLLSLGLAATRHLLSTRGEHPLQVAHNLQWTSRPIIFRRERGHAFLLEACQRKLLETKERG